MAVEGQLKNKIKSKIVKLRTILQESINDLLELQNYAVKKQTKKR